MSLKTVCRLCLAMDAPMRVIADCELLGVYEKLISTSINSAHWPVLACYLCFSQLKKCHNLMMRSEKVHKLLTKLYLSGDILKDESIAMLSSVRKELSSDLSCTPIEIIAFDGECIENNLIKTEVNEEPALSQSTEEMESKGSEDEEMEALKVESQEVIDDEFIKDEVLEEMIEIEEHPLSCENVQYEESEGAKCMKSTKSKGASPIEECGQTHEEQIEHGATEASHENKVQEKPRTRGINIQKSSSRRKGAALTKKCVQIHEENNIREKPRTCKTVIDEESLSIGTYTLQSTRNVAKKKRVLTDTCIYSETAVNNRDASIDTDNDCARTSTDVANSSSKHLNKTFICNDCGDKFDEKYLLIEHIDHHSVVKKNRNRCSPLRAILRNKRFSRTGVPSKYTDINHGKGIFKCEICQRRFTQKGNLKTHFRVHTGEKPFECEICKVRFNEKAKLKTHLRIHTGEKPFECEICKLTFRQRHHLRLHLQTHTGEKPFECDICQRRFTRKGHLDIHFRLHTGEKPFQCEICEARFNMKESLKTHLRTHTGEKPFECEICKVRFSVKCTLKTHLRTHTGEKPFECEMCKVRFNHKVSLMRHLRTHTGEKPFECETCKVRFNKKAKLKTHLRIHTAEKPFECKICKVAFRVKYHLRVHLRTHTGEKPFECEICQRRFTQKCNLNRHFRLHTSEKPF